MNLAIRLFVTSVARLVLLPGCGAQVDATSTARDATGGTSSAATGGTSNASTSELNGGATGTGGATGPDPAYCDGLLLNQNCGYFQRDTDSGPIGCDIALKESPPDPKRMIVAIDCVKQPLVPWDWADAGVSDGFVIDYNPIPAHLILLGTSCEMLQSAGYHAVDVITGCGMG